MKDLVLIVEDETKLASLMKDYLQNANYRCHVIDNGLEVVPWLKQHEPCIVLLDLMLPGKDGISICQEIRTFSQVPIIMATAKVEEIDRLLGLGIGADDYLCKPYSLREMVARVKVILRRSSHQSDKVGESSALVLDENKMLASWKGSPLDLTAVEFKMLLTLSKESGRIFNREQLMHHIYDEYRVVSDRTIDSHVKKLRKKLKEVTHGVELIQSVYSVGYKYEPNDE